MSGPEDLHAVAVRDRQLRGRLLLELHHQPEAVAEERDHLVVTLGRNPEPADPEHIHPHRL
jgi:hypothetical protein